MLSGQSGSPVCVCDCYLCVCACECERECARPLFVWPASRSVFVWRRPFVVVVVVVVYVDVVVFYIIYLSSEN